MQGRHLHDLVPLPHTEEALCHIAERISRVQDYLGRHILIENVSSYLQYRASVLPEWEFLAEVARRSGCGILLDVNNVHVNAVNHGFDARTYLQALPAERVQELHLAGFSVQRCEAGEILVDTHSRPVAEPVWRLYRDAVRLFPAPTLIEWDSDLPPLQQLLEEAQHADRIREQCHARAA